MLSRIFLLVSFTILFFCSTETAFGDTPPPTAPTAPTTEELQRQIAALREENEKLKKPGKKSDTKTLPNDDEDDDDDDDDDADNDDDDLRRKVAKGKKKSEKNAQSAKVMEKAISFNMQIDTFIKDNDVFLPSEISDIVKLAHKETYDTHMAKAAALKASIIQSYFAIQANVDSLTAFQKIALSDYLKLTKTAKEENAASVYENIFEPALEMTRKVKKAEEVGRSKMGFSTGTKSGDDYKNKLIQTSRKAHLNERDSK